MRAVRFCLVTAIVAAGIVGCSDDQASDDGAPEDQVAVVASGAFVGGEEAAFFCQGLDESTMENCAGYRFMLPASAGDTLIDAGVALRDGFRGVRSESVTLRLDSITYDEDLRLFRAEVVAVVAAGEPKPAEVIVGEGDFEPLQASTEIGMEELDSLAAELSPGGTASISADTMAEFDGDHSFLVFTMFPITEAAREELVAALLGEISIETWATFAG